VKGERRKKAERPKQKTEEGKGRKVKGERQKKLKAERAQAKAQNDATA
jgi:hypothetical protein